MSDTSKAGILAITGTFVGLTAITVALRFYARHKAKLRYLADDWLMLVAFIAFIGATVCIFLLVDLRAIGYSIHEFTPEQIKDRYAENTKLQISLNVTTMLCLACTKASALFFYRRIFCTMSPNMRVFNAISIALLVIVACWLVTFELLNGLQCHGHFNTWSPQLYLKYCTISYNFLYGYIISDFLLDVLVVALPIPLVLKLHTTLVKKLSIMGIFMLALVALGASCARMVVFIQVFELGYAKLHTSDSERIVTRNFFFFVLETGCSVVAISLPSLWPLFRGGSLESVMKVARSVTSLTSRSSNRSTRNNSLDPSRADSLAGMKLDDISKRTPGHADVPEMPKQPKLEILRQDTVEVPSKSGSQENGPEDNWRH